MDALILLLVFALSAVGAYLVLAPSQQAQMVRIRALSIRRMGFVRKRDGTLVDEEMELPFARRVLLPAYEKFQAWLLRLTPSRLQQSISLKLLHAGNPMSASAFMGMKVLITAGMGFAGTLIAGPFMDKNTMVGFLLMGVTGMLGWRYPDIWLSRKINARRKLLERALPDVLDLLSVSVEAGLGLDGAIQKVGEKFQEPTAGEFRELLKSIRLGTPRSDALRMLADRTGLPDMRTFAAAVIQAEQLGVSLSRVLRVQSEALRARRKQRAEEKAMQLQVKMLFPLMLFILPTVFIVVLGPVMLQFIRAMKR